MLVNALFLSCALALTPANFKCSESIEEWVRQYRDLKEFIQKIHPGAEVLVTRIDKKPTDPHWERLPFLWKDMSIWIKRHHIYDHRSA